jgi:high-affinity Fe2+/Pb2+ permease
MKKIVITYGLIAGAIVSAFMGYGIYTLNNNPNYEGSMLLGYTGMLVAFSFVFIGVKKYRDNQNEGIITFGKALQIGALISLIASTIYVGVWLFEYYCLYPDFMDKYADCMLKKMDTATMTAAEIKVKTDEMKHYKEMYKNPLWVIILTYAEILIPIGLLVPIISALILKRKQ